MKVTCLPVWALWPHNFGPLVNNPVAHASLLGNVASIVVRTAVDVIRAAHSLLWSDDTIAHLLSLGTQSWHSRVSEDAGWEGVAVLWGLTTSRVNFKISLTYTPNHIHPYVVCMDNQPVYPLILSVLWYKQDQPEERREELWWIGFWNVQCF